MQVQTEFSCKQVLDGLWVLKGREGTISDDWRENSNNKSSNCEFSFKEF